MELNDKQVQLIETAEKLFAEKGFDATSVREIAKVAGINLAMISYYFGSKEKLLEAIFNYRINNSIFESIVNDSSRSPWQKIEYLIDNFIDRVSEKECFHRMMVRQQMFSKNELLTNLLNDARMRNIEILNRTVKEGQDHGQFKENVDSPMLIITMIGTVYQMINTQGFYRKFHGLEKLNDADFQAYMKNTLKMHLKQLFKNLLGYEK